MVRRGSVWLNHPEHLSKLRRMSNSTAGLVPHAVLWLVQVRKDWSTPKSWEITMWSLFFDHIEPRRLDAEPTRQRHYARVHGGSTSLNLPQLHLHRGNKSVGAGFWDQEETTNCGIFDKIDASYWDISWVQTSAPLPISIYPIIDEDSRLARHIRGGDGPERCLLHTHRQISNT